MASTSAIGRNSARSLVFRILTAMSDTLVVVVTARAFGAEGRGLYALASFAGSIIITVLGGIGTALAAEVAHRRSEAGELRAAAVVLSAVGGAVIGAAIA